MPNQTMSIDVSKYPEFQELEPGEKVSVKISGTVAGMEDGMLQIQTESVEQTDVNPAQGAMKDLMGGKREPMSAPAEYDDEDE